MGGWLHHFGCLNCEWDYCSRCWLITPYTYVEGRCADAPILNRGATCKDAHTTDGMPTVWEKWWQCGTFTAETDITLASWRPDTEKQCCVQVRRWAQLCFRWDINLIIHAVFNIINCLQTLSIWIWVLTASTQHGLPSPPLALWWMAAEQETTQWLTGSWM